MRIGVLKETHPLEKRVAVVPPVVEAYRRAGFEVFVESGAGAAAQFSDEAYQQAGANVLPNRAAVIEQAEIILAVRYAGANPERFEQERHELRPGQILIGLVEPLYRASYMAPLAERGVTVFAMELMPRETRAQSMDVLSSMATVAGYKAVLLAANLAPRMFPLLMTAAGTVSPARVFVIGAGVAGLQAMATAKRLGAAVEGYDVRPATREQVESVGAKFVEIPLEVAQAETAGGYARALEEETLRKQQDLLGEHLIRQEVVICTAAVPGKRAPLLILKRVVEQMRPGAVIIDLVAEYGGNCELTQPNEIVEHRGVKIVGAVNLAATVPTDASLLYARNLYNFISHLKKVGMLPQPNPEIADTIARETLVAHGGAIVNPRVKAVLESG
ncbi:MAG: NAD(P) transhydrogenase subunit alpha [Fimbriimonadales bacterium]|jgi:NAD(P) transhydrogenase subunit alpha|nr:NAD(P) transhydrogenase subunit alpha [Fimbriimonadales bacterium]GIV14131.1 MAG: NAD(P) transhydrogenase subunit alpha [Fimbriimonadales bacterium]CUU11094.1 NAD(P) transhydrogenase subunit alpha [Armatimonadetes bacterium GBS]CUU36532.1 NAD(P) transhydrogenase subunit alpha [Armatimonadetes bacterium GXS]